MDRDCEAATRNAGTLGGAREVPVVIADTNFSFRFRVASVTKPNVSVEGLFQTDSTAVIFKTARRSRCIDDRDEREDPYWWRAGGVDHSPSRQGSRRSKGFQLLRRILVLGRHKKQPDRPINLCDQCRSGSQSSKKTEVTENCSVRRMENALEVSTEAVAAKARGIPVMPPLAERQRHRLCWFIFQFATGVLSASSDEGAKTVIGGEREEITTPRGWLDYAYVGLPDEMLVVLTLRGEQLGATEAAAVTEKGPADAPFKITIECLEGWNLKRTPGLWQTVNRQYKC